jgi:hypothetical protein
MNVGVISNVLHISTDSESLWCPIVFYSLILPLEEYLMEISPKLSIYISVAFLFGVCFTTNPQFYRCSPIANSIQFPISNRLQARDVPNSWNMYLHYFSTYFRLLHINLFQKAGLSNYYCTDNSRTIYESNYWLQSLLHVVDWDSWVDNCSII